MKIQIRLLLVFLSLILCSCLTNTPIEIIDVVKLNPTGLTPVTTTLLNPFHESEYFLKMEVGSSPQTISTSSTAAAGIYTLFYTFTVIEKMDAKLTSSLVLYCSLPTGALQTITPSFYHEEDLLAESDGGASQLTRRDYFDSMRFTKDSCTGTISIVITVTTIDTSNLFLIKQLAIVLNTCSPFCTACSDINHPDSCSSCVTGFTREGTTCSCTRQPPFTGLVPQYPYYQCKELTPSPTLPCTEWANVSTPPPNFDVCVKCGGQSQVAQYLKMPYTYSAANMLNTGQAICQCPYGSFSFSNIFDKQCKTVKEDFCIDSTVEVKILAVSTYLANISDNLVVTVDTGTDNYFSSLGFPNTSIFKITFKTANLMTDPHLLSFRAYYSLDSGNAVQINIPQDGNSYILKFNYDNLNYISDCTSEGSVPSLMWKCKINLIAYNPCTNLIHMHAFIPLEIGDGFIKTSTGISPNTVIELDYPCLINRQCYINKGYTVAINLCGESGCQAMKAASEYAVGETVWIKSELTPPSPHTLQYAFFEVYTSAGILAGSIDVTSKYIASTTSDNIYGFPLEIPGDTLNIVTQQSGKLFLTITFKLGAKSLRMLDDSEFYSITTPVTLNLSIVEDSNGSNSAAVTTALIVVLTVFGAALIGVVVYCLVKKKKRDDKRPDAKISATANTGNANLYSEREHQIKEEDQRI